MRRYATRCQSAGCCNLLRPPDERRPGRRPLWCSKACKRRGERAAAYVPYVESTGPEDEGPATPLLVDEAKEKAAQRARLVQAIRDGVPMSGLLARAGADYRLILALAKQHGLTVETGARALPFGSPA